MAVAVSDKRNRNEAGASDSDSRALKRRALILPCGVALVRPFKTLHGTKCLFIRCYRPACIPRKSITEGMLYEEEKEEEGESWVNINQQLDEVDDRNKVMERVMENKTKMSIEEGTADEKRVKGSLADR
ncbi:hypothetical protein PR003_g8473 [Phytophthora rubi]|uniref:Uncharacterized protein n=2 Tax=Phytophthora rubi TaxID=129364 RepID=A0A6A4FJE9_9STRA|nr:hypothetical protein PR003_g8473 [Phytophthora rubi]